MIFMHTWEKVLSGEKTQTRRIVKPKEVRSEFITDTDLNWRPCVLHHVGGNAKWYAGNTYAVQPGRGESAIWYRYEGSQMVFAHESYEIDNNLWAIHGNAPVEGDCLSDFDHCRGVAIELKESGYTQARIRVIDIRCEDVREISFADVRAEGYEGHLEFWRMWCGMHDKVGLEIVNEYLKPSSLRPHELYQAWVLTFELVKDENGEAK